MRSIVRSIHDTSLKYPDKTAIIATDYTINYRYLWNGIANVCLLLKKQGVRTGDRIILEAGPTVEYMICCYGIHLCGAVHVPIEKNCPKKRIDEIASDIQPFIILNGKNPLNHLNSDLQSVIQCDESPKIIEFPQESMLQEILYTTGTTGKSKGVMITHFAQMNMCESQNAVINYSEDNVWMIPTPMNHAAGLRKVHMSMVRGSTVLLVDGFKNLNLFFSNMRKYGVTSLYLPPSAVHYILMLASDELSKFDKQLDFLYSSSSSLPSGDKELLIRILPSVRKFDAYGGSEVGAVAYIDYNSTNKDSRCVGKPNPGVDIFIVDDNYNKINASKDNPGIIAIRSNTITAGYWNEPELTAHTIRNGTIYMTDLGYLDEEGYLYLVGRRDDVINIGGLKVAPTEVEDVLLRFDKIYDCACVPFCDPLIGTYLKMLVVMKKGCICDSAEIISFLKKWLEYYKIPKAIEEVDTIPKTYNGKIDRKKIAQTRNA